MNIVAANSRAALEAKGIVVREGRHLVAKWMELTNLTREVTEFPYGPCSMPVKRQWPFFVIAVEQARKAFVAAGALEPCKIGEHDIRIYEFPRQGEVIFVVDRSIAGKPMEVRAPFQLLPHELAFLRATGRWADVTSH